MLFQSWKTTICMTLIGWMLALGCKMAPASHPETVAQETNVLGPHRSSVLFKEKVFYDIDMDGKPDTLIVENVLPPGQDLEDPDDASLLTIKTTSSRKPITLQGTWSQLRTEEQQLSQIKPGSRYTIGNKVGDKTYLLLLGYLYGAGRETMNVYECTSSGCAEIPTRVASAVVAFEDLNHDGRIELVTNDLAGEFEFEEAEWYRQQMKGNFTAYCPDVVHTLNQARWERDREQEKAYNMSQGNLYTEDSANVRVWIHEDRTRTLIKRQVPPGQQ